MSGQVDKRVRAFEAQSGENTARVVDERVHQAAEDVASTAAGSISTTEQRTRALVQNLRSELEHKF